MSTFLKPGPPTTTSGDSGRWLRRAWGALALVPVFFLLAFAVGEALYGVLGYQPENADAPIWVVLVVLVPILVVVLTPCVAAVFYGRRARDSGDRRGVFPVAIGALVGVGWLVLSIVSEVGNIIRG